VAKRKRTYGHTMIYKTQHRKRLQIEQHEPHLKQEVNTDRQYIGNSHQHRIIAAKPCVHRKKRQQKNIKNYGSTAT
jgi:hypothetical protein